MIRKRLQSSDKVKSYPYGTSVRKVCKEELLIIIKNDFTTC